MSGRSSIWSMIVAFSLFRAAFPAGVSNQDFVWTIGVLLFDDLCDHPTEVVRVTELERTLPNGTELPNLPVTLNLGRSGDDLDQRVSEFCAKYLRGKNDSCEYLREIAVKRHAQVTQGKELKWDPLIRDGRLQLQDSSNKIGLLLGTGPSLNRLTLQHWRHMQPLVDTWGINFVFAHKFIVPDFLHLELSTSHERHVGKLSAPSFGLTAFTQQFFLRSSNHTNLICEQGCFHVDEVHAVQRMRRWTYKRQKMANDCVIEHPDFCRAQDGEYTPSGDVRSPCCVSLNKILDIMARMGYHTIFLLGFDGQTNSYFFEDSDRYPVEKNVYAALRRKHGLQPANTASHSTKNRAYGSMIAKFALHNGIRLINLSGENTTFQPHMTSQTIDDAICQLMRNANTSAPRNCPQETETPAHCKIE